MAQMRELAAGQSTSLPEVVLRAHLTGTTDDASLTARNADGDDVTFRKVDSRTVLVGPASGSVRLVATPCSGGKFAPRTRIGVDLRIESSAIEAQQVITQSADVGALRQYELARLELTPGAGWTMVASNARPAQRVDDTQGLQPETDRNSWSVDERQYPWVAPGRYAFRESRNGAPTTAATAASWALVLDASLSMRAIYSGEQLAALVELVAGILTEWTGRMPTVAITPGLTHPLPVEGATHEPVALVHTVLTQPQAPSWNIVTPAVSDAVHRGARIVAIVTDGAPADTRDLAAYAALRTDIHVIVVAAGRSAYSLPSRRVPGIEELGALADLGSAPNLTVIAVDPSAADDEHTSVELAQALTEVP